MVRGGDRTSAELIDLDRIRTHIRCTACLTPDDILDLCSENERLRADLADARRITGWSAERDGLKRRIQSVVETNVALEAEVERLRTKLASYGPSVSKALAENAALRDRVAAIRSIHQRDDDWSPPICAVCIVGGVDAMPVSWPCPTIRALEADA